MPQMLKGQHAEGRAVGGGAVDGSLGSASGGAHGLASTADAAQSPRSLDLVQAPSAFDHASTYVGYVDGYVKHGRQRHGFGNVLFMINAALACGARVVLVNTTNVLVRPARARSRRTHARALECGACQASTVRLPHSTPSARVAQLGTSNAFGRKRTALPYTSTLLRGFPMVQRRPRDVQLHLRGGSGADSPLAACPNGSFVRPLSDRSAHAANGALSTRVCLVRTALACVASTRGPMRATPSVAGRAHLRPVAPLRRPRAAAPRAPRLADADAAARRALQPVARRRARPGARHVRRRAGG